MSARRLCWLHAESRASSRIRLRRGCRHRQYDGAFRWGVAAYSELTLQGGAEIRPCDVPRATLARMLSLPEDRLRTKPAWLARLVSASSVSRWPISTRCRLREFRHRDVERGLSC